MQVYPQMLGLTCHDTQLHLKYFAKLLLYQVRQLGLIMARFSGFDTWRCHDTSVSWNLIGH